MTEDLYRDFAERYDRFHEEFGKLDRAHQDFFGRLFEDNRVRSVLDCACGTGQHLPFFHSLGCEVMGSDISDSMLAQARKNLDGIGLRIPLKIADYRELPRNFDRNFDAATCLSSSILHMQNEEDVLRAFGSMRDVLRDGGILVLTQGTSDKQWNAKPRFFLTANHADYSRIHVIDYLEVGARYHVLDIDHSDKASGMRVWSVDYPLILLRAEQERLLKTAGFSKMEFYGSFDFEPYDIESSDRLISVAWK